MDVVTALVKDSILNCFSIYPSRMHVLQHVILGNGTGYAWVKCDESKKFVLRQQMRAEELEGSIERKKVDSTHDIVGSMHSSTGNEFYNHIADFVEANIDIYASSSFYSESLNLKPQRPYRISRGYNRLCDMPNIGDVHPDWLEAINELVHHELKVRNPFGAAISVKRSIDLMVKQNPSWVDGYKILLRFSEKYAELNRERDAKNNAAMQKLFGITKIEERYEKSAQNQRLSLEEFKTLRRAFLDSDDSIHVDFEYWLNSLMCTRDKYIDPTSQRFNERFKQDASNVLNSSSLFRHYNQYSSMVGEIMRNLKVHSSYQSMVQGFVNDNGHLGLMGM